MKSLSRPERGASWFSKLAEREERLKKNLVDFVKSGKGLAGLIDLVQKGFFEGADSIVFVHTGGVAGLFGYSDQLKP